MVAYPNRGLSLLQGQQANNNDAISLNLFKDHLAASNNHQADEVTRRILIHGYFFFSEVQFIPKAKLKDIDELWRKYSDGNSENLILRSSSSRVFLNKFIWELNDDTPEGHMPLTNTLRGTQLLNSIMNHIAFEELKKKKKKVKRKLKGLKV
ncbi:hypothetical protein UlMin_031783 [Ulmus minor]